LTRISARNNEKDFKSSSVAKDVVSASKIWSKYKQNGKVVKANNSRLKSSSNGLWMPVKTGYSEINHQSAGPMKETSTSPDVRGRTRGAITSAGDAQVDSDM